MAEGKQKRGEATRAAILQAAEASFAEHGFDGARVDAIAEISGYNKTLIFRYFGDKLGLYAAVLKQADREWGDLLGRLFLPLLEDESIVSDARRFREFLKTALEAFFDYVVDHPHFTRTINWEQADGWKTFAGIASQFEPEDLTRLEAIFSNAQKAGLLRTDLDIIVMILLVQQLCWSSPNALPLYHMVLAGKSFSSATELAYIRQHLIEFLIAGIVHHPDNRDRPRRETIP